MGKEGPSASSRRSTQPHQSPASLARDAGLAYTLPDQNHGRVSSRDHASHDVVPGGLTSHEFVGKAFAGEQSMPIFTDISGSQPRQLERSGSGMTRKRPISQRTGNSPKKRTKMLRRRHDKLVAILEDVRVKELELDWEQEDLDLRMSEAMESQQELMNAFEAKFDGSIATGHLDYLRQVWQRVRSDVATYGARLARIRQLKRLLVEPKSQLLAAEDDFIKTVEGTVTRSPGEDDSAPRRVQGSEPVEEHSVTDTKTTFAPNVLPTKADHDSITNMSANPNEAWSVGESLRLCREDQRMYEERLNDLEWEQKEDLSAREFLLERGDDLDLSEADFMQSYLNTRAQIERDLDEVKAHIARLEMQAKVLGLDVREQARPSDLFSEQTYQNVENVDEVLPQSLGQQPSSPAPIPFDSPARWNQDSTTGSTDKKPSSLLDNWLNDLPEDTERPLSAQGLLGHTLLSQDSRMTETARQSNKRAAKSLR